MPRHHSEGRTQEDRVKIRRKLGSLKQLTVQPATRARYQKALDDFFLYLQNERLILPTGALALDAVVADYLEHLWATGAGRAVASNTLAALQDSQPQIKGKLAQSWRLMKAWSTNEVPNRAPPLPLDVLYAMIGYATFKNWHHFALTLLIGFHGLLRTGEILSLRGSHISVLSPKGPAVLSLGMTKGGKRQGAAESVTIHAEDVCRRLFQWISTRPKHVLLAGPSHVWRKTFADVLSALGFQEWDFRPYSLRRGGATEFFKQQGSFDKLLVLGRWQSSRTARLYLNEGLAVLAELHLPWSRFATNFKLQYLRSLSLSLPKLEPSFSSKTKTRGNWKKGKDSKKRRKKEKKEKLKATIS